MAIEHPSTRNARIPTEITAGVTKDQRAAGVFAANELMLKAEKELASQAKLVQDQRPVGLSPSLIGDWTSHIASVTG